MGLTINLLFGVLLFFGSVSTQDYFEQIIRHSKGLTTLLASTTPSLLDILKQVRHMQHLRTQDMTQLREIPKAFEVTGDDAKRKLMNYLTEIDNLAAKEHINVSYKVKVDVKKTQKQGNEKKATPQKKNKSKKYNIPLKKKNMRLSKFEIIMRKQAESNGQKVIVNPVMTTEETGTQTLSTTAKVAVLKYKPILSRSRASYAKKHVKPVRKAEITLS